MKSNMEITVDFLAGTNLHEAIEEAMDKAKKWDVAFVKFSFNGVNFSITHTCDIKEAVKQFMESNHRDFICS